MPSYPIDSMQPLPYETQPSQVPNVNVGPGSSAGGMYNMGGGRQRKPRDMNQLKNSISNLMVGGYEDTQTDDDFFF